MATLNAEAVKLWSQHGAKGEVFVRLAAGCHFKGDKDSSLFNDLASNFVVLLDKSTAWVFLKSYQKMIDSGRRATV